MKTVVTILAVVIGLAGVEGAGAGFSRLALAQSKSTILERVLVRVNGEIYTQSQLTQHQTDAIRERNKQEPRNVPDAELLKLLNEVTPDILVFAVDELLIAQRGRELGATLTDERFREMIERVKKENNLDDEKLKLALAQEGLTMDQLRANFEKAFLIQQVQSQEIFPRMRITEEELRQYYGAHRESLMTPETITLREIAVLVPGAATPGQPPPGSEELAAAKVKIESIRARAVGGEDFVSLVKEFSDAATKANGGLVGPVNVRDINPVLKERISKLRPGEITEPVQLQRGYQLFKLETRAVSAVQPFDTVRDTILQEIRNERLDGEMKKLKARLRTQAVIEWKDEYLRKIYQTRISEQSAPMKITGVVIEHPVALAPMAGMTDTAFRRLVKRKGGCGLVVTEMVSSEGLVRGIDRTLEYAEYTEEERPVSVQIFGGDPEVMADAAQIVEGMGADIVDVNMGCPVPKIAKHNAGCSLMREPHHAARVIEKMTQAVGIPVTVKMRAGWNESEINAPTLARMVQDAGAAAVAVHGRTAAQSYSGESDWALIARVASNVTIPVFGSGDCIEPDQIVARLRSAGVAGILVGRGALRNPWIFAQSAAAAAGQTPQPASLRERGEFLLDYIDLLLRERVGEVEGFRHRAPGLRESSRPPAARGRERWVINKLRALGSWYSKGLEGGSQLRTAINSAESIDGLRHVLIGHFFGSVRSNHLASLS